MIKYFGAKVLYDVMERAIQVHGSLGYSSDLPLESMYRAARAARIYDGPDEVHRQTVARRVLKGYAAHEVPSEHIPTRRRDRRRRFPTSWTALTVDRVERRWGRPGPAYSGVWQTASTLLPSGSRRKAP